ncbi:arginase family protein [Dickeya poaceiphila]|nr:arginase family protein [Dickeya poaceiphila]
MHEDDLVINRNAVITEGGDKVELILNERRVSVAVSGKMYQLLRKITEQGISLKKLHSTENELLKEITSLLYFNDILISQKDDELLKDGILYNPARMQKAALSIPDTRLNQWCFFGAPADFALDPPRSPAHGPYIYRKLGRRHAEMRDIGDIAYNTTDNIYSFGKKIQHVVRKIKEKDNKTMMFGGDHSLTYFAVAELSRFIPEIVLIQLDAHSDINTSTDKSNVPLYHANFVSRLVADNAVRTVIQIGVREKTIRYTENYLNSSSITQFSAEMSRDDKKRLASLIAGKEVYISFDADVLDPEIFPHVTTPLDKGMSEEVIIDILSLIKNSCFSVEGADIMEFTCGFDKKGNPFNHEMPLLDKIISLIIS